MQIFVGVRWRQMKVGWSKMAKMAIFASFAHYIFQSVIYMIQCHNYYAVIYSRLGGFQWHWNRWPWMTSNGYFALKSVLGSASNGLAYSGFQTQLFENLRSYATSNEMRVVVENGDFRFFRSLSSEHFTYMASGHTTAFTWCDCRWPWRYFKVVRLFHIKFPKNGVWYGKSYYIDNS